MSKYTSDRNWKSPAELLFNHKISIRLNSLRNSLNRQNLKQEENLAEFYTSKKLRTFTPGDATWYCSFQNESNWGRGVVIKKQDQSLILSIIAMVYSRNMLIYFVLLKLT